MKNQLSHFDDTGSAHMVDVSSKRSTDRVAVARSELNMMPSSVKLIRDGKAKKGDVIGVARLAGIMASKKTADLIPLCHALPISHVSIEFSTDVKKGSVKVEALVKTTGKTGVEMEALTAATVAALTIYDMLKATDKAIKIAETYLIFKDGGASGKYQSKNDK